MPSQDKTGPNGQGPLTGRGQGSCQNNSQTATEQDNSLLGTLRRRLGAGQRGRRKGLGRGRGRNSGFRNQQGR